MTALARQVCLNHPLREAVARCVECTRFFCRECIADHDGRLICASCLGKLARAGRTAPRTWPATLRSLATGVAGLALAWLCFYTVGRTLLELPSSFHEDNFWNDTWAKLQHVSGDD